jgi:Predicted oxidoreductases (related to aryl-alcohol dehydrogenases)
MEYKKLGDSDLSVSEICLGTMTYGQQNTVAEAAQQLDFAIDRGINFIDTAEMYPVPGKRETQGKQRNISASGWRNSSGIKSL